MSAAAMPLHAAPQACLRGRLIYLMGASGSGKDTLLRHVRLAVQPQEPVLVAHRYITRPSGADEASVNLSAVEFERRLAMGCFALHWDSHGLRYGIGIEIDSWLARGAAVIINGSRTHLAQAFRRYPGLVGVEVVADPDILARRLAARGRETPEQIEARLRQAAHPFAVPPGCRTTRLCNNDTPDHAAQRLLRLVRLELAAAAA